MIPPSTLLVCICGNLCICVFFQMCISIFLSNICLMCIFQKCSLLPIPKSHDPTLCSPRVHFWKFVYLCIFSSVYFNFLSNICLYFYQFPKVMIPPYSPHGCFVPLHLLPIQLPSVQVYTCTLSTLASTSSSPQPFSHFQLLRLFPSLPSQLNPPPPSFLYWPLIPTDLWHAQSHVLLTLVKLNHLISSDHFHFLDYVQSIAFKTPVAHSRVAYWHLH